MIFSIFAQAKVIRGHCCKLYLEITWIVPPIFPGLTRLQDDTKDLQENALLSSLNLNIQHYDCKLQHLCSLSFAFSVYGLKYLL